MNNPMEVALTTWAIAGGVSMFVAVIILGMTKLMAMFKGKD